MVKQNRETENVKMNIADNVLKNDEKIIYLLRSLYSKYGYSHFKMSQFEEYDLYVRNKDFLISDSVITFTDTNGKLLALKPDVTFSIIKNNKYTPGSVSRYCYNENVYRVSKDTHSFKEIMQAGLECIGDIDDYAICEVLMLAAKSLKCISDDCILTVSYLNFIYEILDDFSLSQETEQAILKCIGEKNVHELTKICNDNALDVKKAESLKELVGIYGRAEDVMPRLRDILDDIVKPSSIDEFEKIIESVSGSDFSDIIRIDFSVVSDMKYYNGVVFKGFVNSVPVGVLSGGQYDRLMQKMGHKSGAIGFAVYLDMLGRQKTQKNYDVDTVLLYDEGADLHRLRDAAEKLILQGQSVQLHRKMPDKLKCRQVMRFEDGEVTVVG